MSTPKETPHTIPVVHKALEVVRAIALSKERYNLTAKVLAAETGISSTTCYRILRTLIAHDWVRPVQGGGHEVSHGLLTLAKQGESHDRLISAARPELAKLALSTKLTVKISVRQDEQALTICRCVSPLETSVSVREGATFPLAYGSSGAVLMSELSLRDVEDIFVRMPAICWKNQTRKQVWERIRFLKTHGYCCDFGSYNPGYSTLSVPIAGENGECIGAFTAIGFSQDLLPAMQPRLKKDLLAGSRRISKRFLAENPSL